MAAYDRLPERLRHRLAEAKYEFSAISAESNYRSCGLWFTLRAIDESEARIEAAGA